MDKERNYLLLNLYFHCIELLPYDQGKVSGLQEGVP